MKDATRVVLVSPANGQRKDFQRQLEEIREVKLVETCPSFQAAIKRLPELAVELVFQEVGPDVESAIECLEALARSSPGVVIVPVGEHPDGALILRTIRAGAREFLPLPATSIELIELIRRLCPRDHVQAHSGPRGPQVIAVTGAGGGVGCTSVAVNLATTLSKLSRRETVLVDFDLLLGSLEETLAVIPDNSLEVVARNIDDMDPQLLKRWLPRHPCGLFVLPHPVSMEVAAGLDPDELRRVLYLLKESFSTVVIDTSKGLQVSDFLAFEMADVILLVIQLNLNCTRNAVRLLQYLRQFDGLVDKVKIVVNRANSPLSEISLKKAEELLKAPVTWQVPNATRLFMPARSRGVPIDEVEDGNGSKAHQAMIEIATALHPYPSETAKPRKRMFSAFS